MKKSIGEEPIRRWCRYMVHRLGAYNVIWVLAGEYNMLHVFELGLHTQFVGQIMDVKADEAVLGAADQPEIDKVRPIIFSPANRVYYGVGPSLGHAFAIGKEI